MGHGLRKNLLAAAAGLAVCSWWLWAPARAKPAPPSRGTAPAHARKAGASRTDGHGIEQVWVPPGKFEMGTKDVRDITPPKWAAGELASEQPQHLVRLSKGFWIDRYEVTNGAFDAFVKEGGYGERKFWSEDGWRWLQGQPEGSLPVRCPDAGDSDHPRACVTWYEAEAYAAWRGGRLPTEAEWEFAARGPDSKRYPWGKEFHPLYANVSGPESSLPVGTYPKGVSWVGAYDMAGNVMEWVHDWLDVNYYKLEVRDDPQGPATGTRKVEKGGWWGSHPFVARCAYRHFEDPPTYQDHHIGFRVASDDEAATPAK